MGLLSCLGGPDSFFWAADEGLPSPCCGWLGSCSDCGSEELGWSSGAGAFGSWPPFSFCPPLGAPPSSIFTMSCPTVTVSSSLTRNSDIVPASGQLTATSIYTVFACELDSPNIQTRCIRTLSVSMVAISSSCST